MKNKDGKNDMTKIQVRLIKNKEGLYELQFTTEYRKIAFYIVNLVETHFRENMGAYLETLNSEDN